MHGPGLVEQLAAIVLVLTGAFFLVASWLASKKAPGSRGGSMHGDVAIHAASTTFALNVAAAMLALGAAAIHAAVTPGHLREYAPFGLGFAALAVVQVAVAMAAISGQLRRIQWPVLIVTLAVIGVWVVSRTLGLPIGPEAWHAEPIGLADSVATLFEVALVAVLLLRISAPSRAWFAARRWNERMSLAVIPLVGVLGLLALVAMASLSAQSDHHAPGAGLDTSRATSHQVDGAGSHA